MEAFLFKLGNILAKCHCLDENWSDLALSNNQISNNYYGAFQDQMDIFAIIEKKLVFNLIKNILQQMRDKNNN
ncbi:hypothetical protein BpHYR1_039515 [Brachionus plicatilis]|uniref:Uncharacterized protein n=1 Tax=Brachionus plicatilis TaxID=10195 RepID=A0A3M7R2K0_BRAPC|nr:hypothetical protein BpHYR1_039515 [Brachionus plicatilis]